MLVLALKNKLFRIIALGRYFIGGRKPIRYTNLAMRSADQYMVMVKLQSLLYFQPVNHKILSFEKDKAYTKKKAIVALKPNLKLNSNCNPIALTLTLILAQTQNLNPK